jgi:hypothetical protein
MYRPVGNHGFVQQYIFGKAAGELITHGIVYLTVVAYPRLTKRTFPAGNIGAYGYPIPHPEAADPGACLNDLAGRFVS